MPKIKLASEAAVVLTVPQFLERYAIGRDTFYNEVNAGRLPIAKVGTRTLVAKIAAAAWFEGRQVRHA